MDIYYDYIAGTYWVNVDGAFWRLRDVLAGVNYPEIRDVGSFVVPPVLAVTLSEDGVSGSLKVNL